jgi:integrase
LKRHHVQVHVRQYADGRWGFDDYTSGRLKKVRRRTKAKADARANDVVALLNNGRTDLLSITREELAEIRARRTETTRPIRDVAAAFLKLKEGRSVRHFESLRRDLALLEEFVDGDTPIGTITAETLQAFLDSRGAGERRRFNLRANAIALFRYARRMSLLPDRMTEAEKVEALTRTPGTVNVLTPAELGTLIENVQAEYLPWLVIGAFAGIRSEEIAPPHHSNKSPLRWEDIDWKHRTITVRAQTSKTREERDVPLLPNLAAWLAPFRGRTGPVCTGEPTKRETARLGKFIGGWRHNALRDSFCSYRARMTSNIPQVSYEMGNSIAMVKRSYHKRQQLKPARAWFNIRPTTAKNVVAFAKLKAA